MNFNFQLKQKLFSARDYLDNLLFSEICEGEKGTLSKKFTASDVGLVSLSVEEKTILKENHT